MAQCPYCHDETGGGETCNSCGAVLSAETAAQLPMRWHKFMIHVVLWVFSAVLLLCAVILWVNRFTLRILPKTSMLASLVLLALAGGFVYARFRLAGMYRKAGDFLSLLLSIMIAPLYLIARKTPSLKSIILFGRMDAFLAVMMLCCLLVAFNFLNSHYYDRRAALFTKVRRRGKKG